MTALTTEQLAEIRSRISTSIAIRERGKRTHGFDDAVDDAAELLSHIDAVTAEREKAEKELNDERNEQSSILCELTEAQHALVLLATQMERHSVPFVPDAEQATAKARTDLARMARLDAIGAQVVREVFHRRPHDRA